MPGWRGGRLYHEVKEELLSNREVTFRQSCLLWDGTLSGILHDLWTTLEHFEPSYREQFKEGDEEADRGNDGKTTSKSKLALNGICYYGQPRTARSGGSWL